MNERFFDDAELLRKSLTGKLSPKEEARLNEMLGNPALKKVYRELLEKKFLDREWNHYAAFSPREGYLAFENRLLKERLRRTVRWASAAAVLLVGLISSALLLLTREPRQELSHAEIIPPGSPKATLTLADGSRVDITPEQPTALQKDGVNILSEGGTLSYSVEEPSQSTVYHELKIPAGGEFHFVLGDGTQVWLNAGTTLRYPAGMTGKERRLYLCGEAYFDVKKDGRRFLVDTEAGTIEVLGTEFGVTGYADEDRLTTTLLTGKIRFTTRNGDSIHLSPGEQIVTLNDGRTLKQQVNVEEFVGWKDGLYVFREKPLKEIMNTFERWYNVSVVYADEAIGERRFTGNVRRYDNINVFLEALRATREVNYRIEGSTIELTTI